VILVHYGGIMKLNDIEKEILIYFYERDFNIDSDKKWEIDKFSLKETDNELKIHEITYYIKKLAKTGYLDLGNPWYHGVHQYNEKYNSNVTQLIPSNIEISTYGKELIIELRKTIFTKIRESITEFLLDIFFQMREKVISHLVVFILGMIFLPIIKYFFLIK
jgi:hypothetical protein